MEPSTSKVEDEVPADDEAPMEPASAPVAKKKRKKSRKVPKAEGFPKFYKNGYVRYCDKMRPLVCEEHPDFDPVKVTKLVAAKWISISNEEKQPYLEEAKLDRERYKREVKKFNRDNPEAAHTPSKGKDDAAHSTKHSEENGKDKTVNKESNDGPKVMNFIGVNSELPIFTDAFLEHNKIIEAELKMLRKNNMEIENSVFMKHVENMTNGVQKVEGEISATKQKVLQLEIYLTKLKCVLASGLNSVILPSLDTGASIENIEKYMEELSSPAVAVSSPAVVNKASEIIRKMDLKFT